MSRVLSHTLGYHTVLMSSVLSHTLGNHTKFRRDISYIHCGNWSKGRIVENNIMPVLYCYIGIVKFLFLFHNSKSDSFMQMSTIRE